MIGRPTSDKKTKILMVLYYYHPYVSGLSIYVKRIAEGLVKEGYEVTILTSRYDKKLAKVESINGVQVLRRPVLLRLGKGVIMPSFIFDIISSGLRNDYVNVHLPMAESGLAALFIPKRKLVTSYVCDIYLGPKIHERLITYVSMALMHLQLMRSRVVIPLSRDYLEHSKMSRYLAKAMPAYPPVGADEFYPINPKPLLRRLKLDGEEIKIGFVGRIVYEKGINYLLEAIPNLQKALPDFKIIIVGDYEKVAGGSVKEELDKYLELYPKNIVFTGYLNDTDRNRLYSGLDVLVLPSIDPLEAFGMVQVEAMLCGSPVVTSNLPGVREVVMKTGFGRISRVADSKDIANQIVEVVTNPKAYEPNRDIVMRHFNPQETIDIYALTMPRS